MQRRGGSIGSPTSSCGELWAPAICGSPLHSGGLSMENPFEMFDEVGRSLKWFSLAKNPPDPPRGLNLGQRQHSRQRSGDSCSAFEENAGFGDCCDSDSSSTVGSWKYEDEEDGEEDQEHSQVEEGDEFLDSRREVFQSPKIEEIFDEDHDAAWSRQKLGTHGRDNAGQDFKAVHKEIVQRVPFPEEDRDGKLDDLHLVSNPMETRRTAPYPDEPNLRFEHPHPVSNMVEDKKTFTNSFTSHVPVKSDFGKDPVSGLVRSFFGTGQEAQKKADFNKPGSPLDQRNSDEIMLLEKKIEILENENSRLKLENQRLSKQFKRRDEEFAQEKSKWEKQNLANLHALQSFHLQKEELLQELKREKRMFEKRLQCVPQQVLNPLPNKTERKEIADLKAKVIDVHEEHLKKEARLRLTNIRLRKLVKELSGKLNERQEEIKRYERILLDLSCQGQLEQAPVKSKLSPEKHGTRTIKSIECSSMSGTTGVGCRIAGALFHQVPDARAKHKKEKDLTLVVKETPSSEKSPKKSGRRSSTTSTSTSTSSGSQRDAAALIEELELPDILLPPAVDDHKLQNAGSMVSMRYKGRALSDLGTNDTGSVGVSEVDVSDLLTKDRTESALKTRQRSSAVADRGPQRRSMVFVDGTREEEYQDGLACVYFANGDIKNSLADGTTEYYYAEIDTWHTTKPDGVEIFYFPHNQIEEHWPNGQKRVIFPDGSTGLIKD